MGGDSSGGSGKLKETWREGVLLWACFFGRSSSDGTERPRAANVGGGDGGRGWDLVLLWLREELNLPRDAACPISTG